MFKLSNCLIWAVWQAIRHGQYVVIRKTRHNHKWPVCKYHFLVLPPEIVREHARSYVPPRSLGDWPMPLFRGSVKKGD